jgi:hypothetical protein
MKRQKNGINSGKSVRENEGVTAVPIGAVKQSGSCR